MLGAAIESHNQNAVTQDGQFLQIVIVILPVNIHFPLNGLGQHLTVLRLIQIVGCGIRIFQMVAYQFQNGMLELFLGIGIDLDFRIVRIVIDGHRQRAGAQTANTTGRGNLTAIGHCCCGSGLALLESRKQGGGHNVLLQNAAMVGQMIQYLFGTGSKIGILLQFLDQFGAFLNQIQQDLAEVIKLLHFGVFYGITHICCSFLYNNI